MDAAAEIRKNPVSKHQIQPENEPADARRDGTVEPIALHQILRRERDREMLIFPCFS